MTDPEAKLVADCQRFADAEDPPPEWLGDGADLARIETWLMRQSERQVARVERIRAEMAATCLRLLRSEP